MKLIDVHAHLEHKRFEKDLDDVIDRARAAGVSFVINSGVNPETNRRALELAEDYDLVRVSFGLYPIDALAKEIENGEAEGFLRSVEKFDVDEELAWIEKNRKKCVAIGEVGLDYNWPDFAQHKEKQIAVFEKVIALAKKLDLPLIVHSRKAEADAMELLEKHDVKKVIMHCFNGRRSLIKRGVENGWYFSVPPVIARLEHFKMLADIVPLKQILTETDAPYLSPVAGERNEPANVLVTIREIARIRSLGEEEVADQIFANASALFGREL
jgi:TatD DNase family protein